MNARKTAVPVFQWRWLAAALVCFGGIGCVPNDPPVVHLLPFGDVKAGDTLEVNLTIVDDHGLSSWAWEIRPSEAAVPGIAKALSGQFKATAGGQTQQFRIVVPVVDTFSAGAYELVVHATDLDGESGSASEMFNLQAYDSISPVVDSFEVPGSIEQNFPIYVKVTDDQALAYGAITVYVDNGATPLYVADTAMSGITTLRWHDTVLVPAESTLVTLTLVAYDHHGNKSTATHRVN